MEDPLEEFDKLSEMEQFETEQRMLDRAFRNSFLIITKRKTFETVVKETGGLLVVHDPHQKIKLDSLTNMMEHFTVLEEYEKCAEIRDLIVLMKAKKKKKSIKKISEDIPRRRRH